ncbi:uncharacterized protein PAN0_009c3702 [Moesziomyces antarcticus]|uniref:Uncharacterized protein n=2 Tax=Pseudozyma antarctica TaxID=84753 RepID=A0A5C3FPW2_PSEA2|nr:uncharacterized protein PAN0_009c3702 [Moesziomyces antarcticus]GAK65485.1 hypothetical protein PAN0_009c3702 [Moesziomyces antarcticus]SPO46493.1 uncharacterized protein PSANT_04179 [Moesziomyces antarcticus]
MPVPASVEIGADGKVRRGNAHRSARAGGVSSPMTGAANDSVMHRAEGIPMLSYSPASASLRQNSTAPFVRRRAAQRSATQRHARANGAHHAAAAAPQPSESAQPLGTVYSTRPITML